MPNLTLTGQATQASQIQTRITTFQTLLNQRKPFWDRMPIEKKRAWIESGKDPVLNIAWDLFKYFKDNFFMEGENWK